MKRAVERLERLIAARNLMDSSPELLAGTPVIRGTRIPVYDVAASTAAGIPIERMLTAYPSLDLEKVELATIFAEAYPLQGRPRSRGELPKGGRCHCFRSSSFPT